MPIQDSDILLILFKMIEIDMHEAISNGHYFTEILEITGSQDWPPNMDEWNLMYFFWYNLPTISRA